MTIKVFTAPRRMPYFEIWRLESPPAYTASQNRRNPPSLNLLSNPLLISSRSFRFLFRIRFPVSLPNVCTYTRARIRAECRDARWSGLHSLYFPLIPPRGFPYYLQPPRSARRPRNNSVRVRESASVSPNWWKPRTS